MSTTPTKNLSIVTTRGPISRLSGQRRGSHVTWSTANVRHNWFLSAQSRPRRDCRGPIDVTDERRPPLLQDRAGRRGASPAPTGWQQMNDSVCPATGEGHRLNPINLHNSKRHNVAIRCSTADLSVWCCCRRYNRIDGFYRISRKERTNCLAWDIQCANCEACKWLSVVDSFVQNENIYNVV